MAQQDKAHEMEVCHVKQKMILCDQFYTSTIMAALPRLSLTMNKDASNHCQDVTATITVIARGEIRILKCDCMYEVNNKKTGEVEVVGKQKVKNPNQEHEGHGQS